MIYKNVVVTVKWWRTKLEDDWRLHGCALIELDGEVRHSIEVQETTGVRLHQMQATDRVMALVDIEEEGVMNLDSLLKPGDEVDVLRMDFIRDVEKDMPA